MYYVYSIHQYTYNSDIVCIYKYAFSNKIRFKIQTYYADTRSVPPSFPAIFFTSSFFIERCLSSASLKALASYIKS